MPTQESDTTQLFQRCSIVKYKRNQCHKQPQDPMRYTGFMLKKKWLFDNNSNEEQEK
jgi:hypothetical protein